MLPRFKRVWSPRWVAMAWVFGVWSLGATPMEAEVIRDLRIARVEGLPDAVALIVRDGGALKAERLRVFFDTEPRRGEPNTGADLLLEGPGLHVYPRAAVGWEWERIGAPVFSRRGDELVCVAAAPGLGKPFTWFAEVTAEDWSTLERWPKEGSASADPARMEVLSGLEPAKPVDLSPLLNAVAPSLSIRLNGGPDLGAWRSFGRASDFDAARERWTKLGWKRDARLRARLRDAESGEEASLTPREIWRKGDAIAWRGETLDVEWALVLDDAGRGEFRLTGWLRSAKPRVVRVEAGLATPLGGLTWADDLGKTREIGDEDSVFGHFASGRYGLEGRQSYNPIAVVEDESQALVLETDVDEPRVFDLSAGGGFFRAAYEMALTPETAKFPGQATFRCAFYVAGKGAEDGFRAALAEFYRRWPDYADRRVPRSGLWMPFSDISKLPHPEDFGFSFFEKTGDIGADVEFARRGGVLTLMYAEPWLYWLPLDAGEERTPERAVEKMRRLAALGSGWSRDLAASGLAGASRDARGGIQMKFMDLPWNHGARLEVSADPDLAGIASAAPNRAMAEWRRIEQWLNDPRVDGVYLDSMDAAVMPDHASSALRSTDFPATYTRAGLKAVVAPNIPQYEFTAALGGLLRSRGKFLMANFPLTDSPFLNRWIDIPGEETDWWSGGQYNPPARSKLDYRRAFSGRKPFGFLQSTDFRSFTGEPLRRYFETCLFYGFLPSFFSHNAADDPYWHDAKLLERDRPLFKTYVPLARRVADAGWEPVRSARVVEAGDVRLEQFGRPGRGVWHLLVRNEGDGAREAIVSFPAGLAEHAWIEPLTGRAGRVVGGGRLVVSLAPDEVVLLDMVPPDGEESEEAFLRDWKSGFGESDAARTSWGSLRRERLAGFAFSLKPAGRGILGRASTWTLSARNEGLDTAWVEIPGGGRAELPPRAGAELEIVVPAAEEDVVVLRWRVAGGGGVAHEFARAQRAGALAPVGVTGPGERFLSRDEVARVPFRLQNHTNETLRCEVGWGTGSRSVRLAAGADEAVVVEVPATKEGADVLSVTVSADGRVWWRKDCRILFLDSQASLAAAPGVQVTTDSTFGGYDTKPLVDGVTKTGHLAWNEAAWASADSPEEHWIRLAFPTPVAVQEVVIHWHEESGITYTGRSGALLGEVATGQELALVNWSAKPGEKTTRIPFPRQMFRSLRVVQHAGQGASRRPGLMWVAEVQAN